MFDIPPNDWALNDEEIQKHIMKIYSNISVQGDYAPLDNEVLRFLTVKIDLIKVVVLGEDPYPSSRNGMPEATGRSFEVRSINSWNETSKCKSICTILKAIYHSHSGEKLYYVNDVRRRIKKGDFSIVNPCDWFDSIENQGVLWLNCSLTRGINDNNLSHENLWSDFMDIIVRRLNEKNVTWIAMGNKAKYFLKKRGIDEKYIISSCHPRHSKEFLDNNPFNKTNNIEWC